jgi:hypothetical protein
MKRLTGTVKIFKNSRVEGFECPLVRCVLLCFSLFLSSGTFAQFPAPDSFKVRINYVLIDEMDWCNDHIIYGPNYCNLYSWETPDTTATSAILTGYRVYKDDQPFLFSGDNEADTIGAFIGNFYVTALYENPNGESPPSNVVLVEDLPITTVEADKSELTLTYHPSLRLLRIEGASQGASLAIYNMRGQLVLADSAVENEYPLCWLAAGGYWVVVRGKEGRSYTILIHALP